jgi:hypothetical protein
MIENILHIVVFVLLGAAIFYALFECTKGRITTRVLMFLFFAGMLCVAMIMRDLEPYVSPQIDSPVEKTK